jgi:hypothetical protein
MRGVCHEAQRMKMFIKIINIFIFVVEVDRLLSFFSQKQHLEDGYSIQSGGRDRGVDDRLGVF